MYPTLIIRHTKENKKKCTLQPLLGREDFQFFTYPKKILLPPLQHFTLLSLEGEEPLSSKDSERGLILLDGTWKYALRMYQDLFRNVPVIKRYLPTHYKTAYPRKQEDCPNPSQGLASIEALYLAHKILGKNTKGLLDHYYFKDAFLTSNYLN